MTPILFRLTSWIARAAVACVAALTLASCGGGVSASPSPLVDSATITILPATAVMYSGLPTTFVLSGGTGSYIIASSDQAVLQVSGGVTGRSVTLIPNNVTADTPVTLTVRDTGSAAPVSASVTVRPGTVNNSITITPSSTQAASCSPAICSGGDAEVQVTISQGGIPLAARGVRFEVVSGDFSFVASTSGVIELAGAAFVTTTDETGVARAKIQVTALAPNQTALLRVTDLATGAYRQTSFAIAQYTGNTPAFFTLPSTITFTGPYADVCASGANADVSVFGGTPPYSITGSGPGYYVTGSPVMTNGGQFRVNLSYVSPPVCITDATVGVTDATGRTITVTLNNVAGTGTAPAPAISLYPVTPPAIAIGCGTSVSFVVQGGIEPFNVSSDHPRVTALVSTVGTRTITVTRLGGPVLVPPVISSNPDPAPPYPLTAHITVTDGTTTALATVSVPATCN